MPLNKVMLAETGFPRPPPDTSDPTIFCVPYPVPDNALARKFVTPLLLVYLYLLSISAIRFSAGVSSVSEFRYQASSDAFNMDLMRLLPSSSPSSWFSEYVLNVGFVLFLIPEGKENFPTCFVSVPLEMPAII